MKKGGSEILEKRMKKICGVKQSAIRLRTLQITSQSERELITISISSSVARQKFQIGSLTHFKRPMSLKRKV
jgi:hypothetical protein